MKPWLEIATNLWIHEFCLNKIITSYIVQCFMLYKAISHHSHSFRAPKNYARYFRCIIPF